MLVSFRCDLSVNDDVGDVNALRARFEKRVTEFKALIEGENSILKARERIAPELRSVSSLKR